MQLSNDASGRRAAKLAAEGRQRREQLLKVVPDTFTHKQCIISWKLESATTSALIQKMLRWKEIICISGYKKPAIYQKVKNETTSDCFS